MSDPDPDDDALTWSGDDPLQSPAARAPRAVAERPARRPVEGSGGLALLLLGVLGGVAAVETLLWIRSVLDPSIAASVTVGSGSVAAVVAFVANVAGRALAVAAPLVWFGVAAWKVRTPSKRLAWMLLGAVLLVPWPFVLRLT